MIKKKKKESTNLMENKSKLSARKKRTRVVCLFADLSADSAVYFFFLSYSLFPSYAI